MSTLIDALQDAARRIAIIYALTIAAAVAGCWSPIVGFLLFLVGLLLLPGSIIGVAVLAGIQV